MTLKHFDKPPIEIRKLARALSGCGPSLSGNDAMRHSRRVELIVFESNCYAFYTDDDCVNQLLIELGKAFTPVEILLRISPPPKKYNTEGVSIQLRHRNYHVVASVEHDLSVLGALFSVVANHETWSFVGFNSAAADNSRRLANEADTETMATECPNCCFVLTIDLDGIMRGIAPTGKQFDVFLSRLKNLNWVE